MNTTIRLKIKKEVDTPTARKILKLKGSIISSAFTDLIHYDDADEINYIHYFLTANSKKKEVTNYIQSYIHEEGLGDIISITI
ncbi:hypothetical protein MH928_13555 [Flavobacterium sp. WW92]|uniref:hypothetical protein n=1 Tax=unclassified Flavobacterium TaxID=196869 RepID=UPI0022244AD8|nr:MULTISPECIES: hypothetical protein [unclassified Flavobacterium]WDO12346.1 hypothetical protein MH928_13555 [Flavobacterium sp. WW92]